MNKLTDTMKTCLHYVALHGGKIDRWPGGFWREGTAGLWFGTTTIEALVKRGKLRYSAYRESQGRSFPIQAELVEAKSNS